MTIRSEEIRARVAEFASRWSNWDKSERSGAQSFLIELFACYGTTLLDVAEFEKHQEGKFLDCHWPRNCIIEMKAPGEAKRLAKHRKQALDYWRNSADPATNTPAPRYVVICAFRTLEVWEPGAYPNEPRAVLDLLELPERYETLLFLSGEGEEAVFTGSQQQVTREAVGKVAELFHMLEYRSAASEGELQDFLLQSVWCMFAEDLAMIPAHGFTRLLEDLLANPRRSSADDLGRMFELLNSPPSVARHGLYRDVPYANGGLFAEPTHIHLEREELQLLLDAAREYRWNEVDPSIFGSLLEGGLGRDQQWALGAHYTHEVDIQKVVQPTIVRPWRERIENCTTLKQATDARRALSQYVVLDPACGSGNFLYVAYRELRRIERDLNERIAELERHAGRTVPEGMTMGSFPLTNMKGIELEGFAVKLARVTLWMGHKLAIDEVGLAEDPLPLADLSGIKRGDALRAEWPKADAIIGNPPFHGDKQLRRALGDEYVEWLSKAFGVGIQDYCAYWFRRAHDAMEPGARAGLVATNTVSQGRTRDASLGYVVEHGGTITDAISSQVWPGEAAVHVSIVNWIKGTADTILLNGDEVTGISPSLHETELDITGARKLSGNDGRSFIGFSPGVSEFVIDEQVAQELLTIDPSAEAVIRPFLSAKDIGSRPGSTPSRWLIDFAMCELEEAQAHPEVLEYVRAHVKPKRDVNRNADLRRLWWRLQRPRPAFRTAISGARRYLVIPRHGKRVMATWCPTDVRASDAVAVFAFEDDYAFGIMASSLHGRWAAAQSSTLKNDIRYTPSTAFDTFPWPSIDTRHRDRVAELGAALYDERSKVDIEHQLGLTALYNAVDDGAFRHLADLHRQLDEAVAEAYGWPKSIAHDGDETNRRLLDLNAKIADGEISYDPFPD